MDLITASNVTSVFVPITGAALSTISLQEGSGTTETATSKMEMSGQTDSILTVNQTTTDLTRIAISTTEQATTALTTTTNATAPETTTATTTVEVTTTAAITKSEATTSFVDTTVERSTSALANTTSTFASTTAFQQTSSITNATTENPFTTTATTSEEDGGGLLFWHIIIIAAGSALLLLLIIILLICYCRSRRKKFKVQQQKKIDDMWNHGTGGIEIPMMNITANTKTWKNSTESIDEKITTAGAEPVAVNVFAEAEDKKNTDAASSSSEKRKSVSSENGEHKQKQESDSKAKKPLTKVEMPVIEGEFRDGDDKTDNKSAPFEVESSKTNETKIGDGTKALPDEENKVQEKNSLPRKESKKSLQNFDDLPPPPPPPEEC